jgi:hypothetical protein
VPINEDILVRKLNLKGKGPANLSDEIIARINLASSSLQPTHGSGLYDHETWALEPLARPEQTLEKCKVDFGDDYRQLLQDFFKTFLILGNNPKPVTAYGFGSHGRVSSPGYTIISIRPNFSVEHLPTYYLRRGIGYALMRKNLTSLLGHSALRQLHRTTPNGRADQCLDDELRQMQDIFFGAYRTAQRELGLESKKTIFHRLLSLLFGSGQQALQKTKM